MDKKSKTFKRIIYACLGITCLGIASLIIINTYVKHVAADKMIDIKEAAEWGSADCILVLGCQVRSDGTPSLMLSDRLDLGIELYNIGAAPKLLMSGDHGQVEYNEVSAMKQYATDTGIASEDIFMDHAGFSTYESIYRAKEIFGVEKIIIVSQEYHLYRALYIADNLGLEAYGVAAEGQNYAGQSMRDFREVLARAKDFATVVIKPEPTYLGETISIEGNGDVTN